MKTIGIIAEFNPFHNGHLHLIRECKRALNADYCVVVMSGDFVQRGAPALLDKFTRTQMALSSGADVVIELPIYYSLGSAEYFAKGAVSILDKLGIVDYLCFGYESGELSYLEKIAELFNSEPDNFRDLLSSYTKKGLSFASAREKAAECILGKEISSVLNFPNNILAIEYLRALYSINSSIRPFTVKRYGEGYNSEIINEFASATAIRNVLLQKSHASRQADFAPTSEFPYTEHCKMHGNMNTECYDTCESMSVINTSISAVSIIKPSIPAECFELLSNYKYKYGNTASKELDMLFGYKLISSAAGSFTKYLDISEDMNNKIKAATSSYAGFDSFCRSLKSKNLAYSRISRALMHILLDIKASNMQEYKEDNFTAYARILGMKASCSEVLRMAKEVSSIPVVNRLKDADSESTSLTPLQKRLLDETLVSSKIYSLLYKNRIQNEYSLKQLVIT